MFERFTDRARRVVVLAQEEARILDHNYIGTEHILLGLVHEDEGVAAKALEELGVSLQLVRQQVEELIGRGKHAPSGHIPFTPRAKKVLELSLREALQLGHNYIGTEHILLGLIREGHGVAAQVLVRLGADLDRVRQQVIELVRAQEGEAGSSRPFQASLRGLERVDIGRALNAINERLSAIERHLGVPKRPDGEAALASEAGLVGEAGAAGEAGTAGEGAAGKSTAGKSAAGREPPGEGDDRGLPPAVSDEPS
jgi:ATP-dependent Clp protease ATP-binding subunit ClpA